MFVKDLESLKYPELQKLAKSAGIKANQKVDKLLKALKEYYIETEDDKEGPSSQASTSDQVRTGETSQTNVLSASGTASLSAAGSTGRVTPDASVSRSLVFSPLQKLSASLAALRKATPTRLPAQKTSNQDCSTSSADKPVVSAGVKKRRRTFELDEPTLSAQNTPVLDDSSGRRTTRQRNSDAPSEAEQDGPAAKRIRRNTFNKDSPSQTDHVDHSSGQSTSCSSPSTRALIQEMDSNLSSAERKEQLLSALDKKIKNKAVGASPARVGATQPSQIPRFMAFLTNKKTESQRPVTPGNKDWTKIHKKEFSKFDSLDVYLEKKQQRMETLSGSAKILAARPSTRRRCAVIKPVARLQVPVKPFVPAVTSTKNINFNFGKTPATPSVKANDISTVQTPGVQGPAASAKKTVGTGNRATPFIFTGNSSSHNTTVTSAKKTFDLKASLAKPLKWKPHTGKLQPLDFNRPQQTSVSASTSAKRNLERPSRQAMASKTRLASVKNVRRAEQLDRRNNQKYVDMMKRRGLLA